MLIPSDVKGSQSSEPSFTAPIPQVWDVAPVNAAKHALELSPGPKSPSALHAQKHSKDDTILFGQKTMGSSVSSNLREYSIRWSSTN